LQGRTRSALVMGGVTDLGSPAECFLRGVGFSIADFGFWISDYDIGRQVQIVTTAQLDGLGHDGLIVTSLAGFQESHKSEIDNPQSAIEGAILSGIYYRDRQSKGSQHARSLTPGCHPTTPGLEPR
jgi:hypothetical protein